MKIIVDMMGGDNAPLAVLEGTAQAVKEYGVQVIGVGSEELVRKTAAEHNIPLDGIELVNCTETIEMCDEPARAIRSKKDSSIVVGLNLLKEGKGDAFVSAGSTGALHVGASLIVRTLKGVKRPALATMVWTCRLMTSSSSMQTTLSPLDSAKARIFAALAPSYLLMRNWVQ